eukprot:5904038-Ditylum_brightwellii.AAC.1
MNLDYDDFGEENVTNLPTGLIFCVVWTDVKLDLTTLHIHVSEDAYSVMQKKATPVPNNACELLE